MPEQLVQLRATARLKAIVALLLLVSLVATWYVLRWYIGNTMAEYFPTDDPSVSTARMAVGLAPNDPLPHWRLGDIVQRYAPPDEISVVVTEFEKAVSLSPNDYRLWMEYGRALEQAGETEKAEKALREAVRLAPSYAYPRWYLGNLLVRTDRYDEGYAELKKASIANEQFQPQLFNLIWQLNKTDVEAMKTAIGNPAWMRGVFAKYLIERKRYDEGLQMWHSLREVEKKGKPRNRRCGDQGTARRASLSPGHGNLE